MMLQVRDESQGRRKRMIPSTPAELLIQLKADYPQDSRETRIKRCIELCVARDLFFREFADGWFRLNYNTIVMAPEMTKESLDKRKHERTLAVSKYVGRAKKYLMLRLASRMPDGKSLAQCVGAEIAQWGGQFSIIAARMTPTQKVGDVFKTDADLAKALKGLAGG
jgi:hypothetical protein